MCFTRTNNHTSKESHEQRITQARKHTSNESQAKIHTSKQSHMHQIARAKNHTNKKSQRQEGSPPSIFSLPSVFFGKQAHVSRSPIADLDTCLEHSTITYSLERRPGQCITWAPHDVGAFFLKKQGQVSISSNGDLDTCLAHSTIIYPCDYLLA